MLKAEYKALRRLPTVLHCGCADALRSQKYLRVAAAIPLRVLSEAAQEGTDERCCTTPPRAAGIEDRRIGMDDCGAGNHAGSCTSVPRHRPGCIAHSSDACPQGLHFPRLASGVSAVADDAGTVDALVLGQHRRQCQRGYRGTLHRRTEDERVDAESLSLSTEPNEGAGSRAERATVALPEPVQLRLAGTQGRLQEGGQDDHGLRPDEVSDRNQGGAARIQGRVFAGVAGRSEAAGQGISSILPQGQGGAESGLSPVPGPRQIRLALLSPVGIHRLGQDGIFLQDRQRPYPSAPPAGRQDQDSHHSAGMRGMVRPVCLRSGGAAPSSGRATR